MAYNGSLNKVKKAIIDPEGTFKYIQIYVEDLITKESVIAVRGYKGCEYHPDILDVFRGIFFYFK